MGAYALAVRQNVDYVEPDIALTKDNKIICIHELELSAVTDVDSKPEFQDRKKNVTLANGLKFSGWFADSFTLEEIKTLRVKQRLRTRELFYDNLFEIPTLEEAIDLVQNLGKQLNVSVGMYIEPKHPTYFASHNLTYDDELFRVLTSKGYTIKGAGSEQSKVIIECFESTLLQRLRPKTDLTLVQLIDRPELKSADTLQQNGKMATKNGILDISKYANAIGPLKRYLYKFDKEFMDKVNVISGALSGQNLVDEIHKYKMTIHPWTTRNIWEENLLQMYFNGSEMEEYKYLYEIGVDGIFTESAGAAICAKKLYIDSLKDEKPLSLVPIVLIPILTALVFLLIGMLIGRTFLSKHYPSSVEKKPLI